MGGPHRLGRLVMLLWLAACQPATPGSERRDSRPSASAATSTPADPPTALREQLRRAEQRRDSAAIERDVLSHRDVSVRRSAARALARLADPRSAELLELALADEDAEVITWAAYGLGYACSGRETKTVRALVARAASLPEVTQTNALSTPVEAISEALGRCAGPDAESTLRAWLFGPAWRAEAAALALGRIAEHSGKLSDVTLVDLLDAADRVQDPVQNALYPLTRLAELNQSTAERARVLATRLISARAPGAEFAVRALARCGPQGTRELGALLAEAELAPGLRAEAARELELLGVSGQSALWSAFDSVLERLPSDAEVLSPEYGPLSALVTGLRAPVLGSDQKLRRLAELTLDSEASPTLMRRKARLRCAAAALLAGRRFEDATLLACDPSPSSRLRELAVLQVIGRSALRGPRKQAFLSRANGSDSRVREAALDALAEHAELSESYQVLSDALRSKELGVIASAARLLASYPERAARGTAPNGDAHAAPSPDASIVTALPIAFAEARARHSVELEGLLLDALGALQILSLKETANAACRSDQKTLREHAQKALRLLGERTRRCEEFEPGAEAAGSLATAASGKVQLRFDTEVGPLTLQLSPRLAPTAFSRIVELARSGFYDGLTVHRVVPGFVAQFGDPEGDGYGGDGKAPLRCETAPVPFEVGSVGVALSGRDTGSSQLFVTLGRYPHLDGQYAWLGEAGPGWDRLAPGERILHATVSSMP